MRREHIAVCARLEPEKWRPANRTQRGRHAETRQARQLHQLPSAVSASPQVQGPHIPVAGTTGDAPHTMHFLLQSGSVRGAGGSPAPTVLSTRFIAFSLAYALKRSIVAELVAGRLAERIS
jgi:hypothetical protein